MKNNKGISIVEIIISITLISIILVFLFTMLITVKNEDDKSKHVANMLVNQALIIKEIETDFIDYELTDIASCSDCGTPPCDDSIKSILPQTTAVSLVDASPKGNCLKLIYNPAKFQNLSSTDPENIGYLTRYSYRYSGTISDPKYIEVVSYRRGEKSLVREIRSLEASGEISPITGTVLQKCGGNACAISIDLPISDDDGEDYGVHLGYVYDQTLWNIGLPADDIKYNFNFSG